MSVAQCSHLDQSPAGKSRLRAWPLLAACLTNEFLIGNGAEGFIIGLVNFP